MEIGQVFDGRYKILKILGQGGMSKVYMAENIKLGNYWAIKEIYKKPDSQIDFLVEPNILKRLNHPLLPRIFDIIEEDSAVYIIVDYIEGMSLDRELAKVGKFPESLVINWARQICEVLAYLHSFKPNPIIYRDMKPSNIILMPDGSIKLIDFGIAREYKNNSDSDTVYIGTRGYAAPEQYGGSQTNVMTDIYSLGVTLYSLVTGKKPNDPPYGIKPFGSPDINLSETLLHIIVKCTRQDPSQRYQSVREIITELDEMANPAFEGDSSETGNDISLNKNASICQGNFKKLVITIWDNAEFGCEFAYTAARYTHYSVFLVDLNLLAPSVDLHLNVAKYPDCIAKEGLYNKSGLSLVMDSIGKNSLNAEIMRVASVKRRELKNLLILTGNYVLENYEYYDDGYLVKLIETAYRSFDITVLLVNRSIYDSYTVISLLRSDYNILAIRADCGTLREFNKYLMFLKEKQDIPMEKTMFVAFEYEETCNLDKRVLDEVTESCFIGSVRYSRKRAKYRNMKSAYARRMENCVVNDYIALLGRFCIMPRPSLFSRLANSLERSARSLKAVNRAIKSAFGKSIRKEAKKMPVISTHHAPLFTNEEIQEENRFNSDINKLVSDVTFDILRDFPELVAEVANGKANRSVLETAIVKDIDLHRYNIGLSREGLIGLVFDYMFGYGLLQPYVEDEEISDIDGTKYNEFSIKKNGIRQNIPLSFGNEEMFDTYCKLIAIRNGGILNENDSHCRVTDIKNRLRINVSIRPRNISGPSISIRKHRKISYSLDDLVALGMISEAIANFMKHLAHTDASILFCGKGAAGKTTLMRAFVNALSEMERVLIAESDAEIYPDKPHCIEQRIKKQHEGGREVTLKDLVRDGLTMSLDTYCVGEIVGDEAWEFVKAVFTGHRGIATIHSESAEDSLVRLLTLSKSASIGEGEKTIREMICKGIDVVFFLKDFKVAEVLEVSGYDSVNGSAVYKSLFAHGMQKKN